MSEPHDRDGARRPNRRALLTAGAAALAAAGLTRGAAAEDQALETLMGDAQRVIEAIETLVRMHTAQEEDIYEAVAARTAG